jgi:hypothetical protein
MMILFLDTYVSITIPLCEVASIPAILLTVPRRTLETFTGNMLGDRSVRYSNFSRDRKVSGNARYNMTMSVVGYEYLVTLYNTISISRRHSGFVKHSVHRRTVCARPCVAKYPSSMIQCASAIGPNMSLIHSGMILMNFCRSSSHRYQRVCRAVKMGIDRVSKWY